MFSDPSFLAAFVRWNMPLMAGGENTLNFTANSKFCPHASQRLSSIAT
jgi:hypothetical protein